MNKKANKKTTQNTTFCYKGVKHDKSQNRVCENMRKRKKNIFCLKIQKYAYWDM